MLAANTRLHAVLFAINSNSQRSASMSNPSHSPSGPSPATLDEMFKRAEAAFHADRYDEAEMLYRKLLEANIPPGALLVRLAMIANYRRDYDLAWRLQRESLAVDPALAAKIAHPDYAHRGVICRATYDTEEVNCCPVCRSTEQRTMMIVNLLMWSVYHSSFDPVRRWVQCQKCGHGFANPRPAASALRESFYDPAPPHLTASGYDRVIECAAIIHRLWERCPGGSFLDVGTSNGIMAAAAVDFGFAAWGIDTHPGYADAVRRLGVEFVLGDVCDHDFRRQMFDLITLGDVIEHVADPHKLLGAVRAVLKPNGLIWFSTPNYEGVWTRLQREKDGMWLEGEHLQYFCRRSLLYLLDQWGLKVVDFSLSRRYIGCMEVTVRLADG